MKNKLLISTIILSIIFSSFITVWNKKAYYNTLASESETEVTAMLIKLNSQKTILNSKAYIAALTIKKANFIKVVKEKIATTKNGITSLETEIKKNPNNIEYRFLRLIMQENVPKIIKYNTNIVEDKKKIIQAYPKLNQELKEIIKNYSKTSKIIQLEELN